MSYVQVFGGNPWERVTTLLDLNLGGRRSVDAKGCNVGKHTLRVRPTWRREEARNGGKLGLLVFV